VLATLLDPVSLAGQQSVRHSVLVQGGGGALGGSSQDSREHESHHRVWTEDALRGRPLLRTLREPAPLDAGILMQVLKQAAFAKHDPPPFALEYFKIRASWQKAVTSLQKPISPIGIAWQLGDVRRHFARMLGRDRSGHLMSDHGGVTLPLCPWRVDSSSNLGFALCESYPLEYIVPSGLRPEAVRGAAAFHARHRLPVVSWFHGGVALLRSSQARSGILGASSANDEALYMEAYRAALRERDDAGGRRWSDGGLGLGLGAERSHGGGMGRSDTGARAAVMS